MIRQPSGYTSTEPELLKNRKKNKPADEAIGRSRGGLTTKIHLSTDNKGTIRQMLLTGGQTADVRVSLELTLPVKPKKVVADKAYDADWLLHYLDSENIKAVIPLKKSRLVQRPVDYKAYKQRNIIERTISRLKQYRKIVTHYEKTATSYPALCCLAATFCQSVHVDVNIS